MNLYEISAEMQRLIEASIDPETGEITNENLFKEVDTLNLEKEAKIEYWGLVIKNNKVDADLLKAQAKVFKEEAAKLEAQAEAKENNSKSIKRYLMDNLAGEKFKTPLVSMYYHTSEKVNDEHADLEHLPDEYIKVEKSLKKDDVKKALKEGKEIEGCTLEVSTSLVVR